MVKVFIDREKQRELIEAILTQAQNREISFSALEFFGVAGIGKSAVLEEAKQQCRKRNLAFAVIDFLNRNLLDTDSPQLEVLIQICDQLDHYFSLPDARGVLGQAARNGMPHELDDDTFSKFRVQLSGAIGNAPLILMFDSVERCPDTLFDWLGREFIGRLVEERISHPTVLFLAGRGPRVKEGRWSQALVQATDSYRLDPLDFDATAKHIAESPLAGDYRKAAKEIFALSNGHPYSTETVVARLNELGIKVEAVSTQRTDLARRLYEGVLQNYILADAPDWVLPFVEIASVFRWFNPGFLQSFVRLFYPGLAPNQPPQWYRMRLVDLQKPPLHLVNVDKRSGYELEPTLRKLMHTALGILKQSELSLFHREAEKLYEEELKSDATRPAVILEMVFHAAQIAVIEGKKVLDPVRAELDRLLKQHINPKEARGIEQLNYLRDLLEQDTELGELIGATAINQLTKQVEDSFRPEPSGLPYQSSHLIIEHFPPSEYRVSWYHSNQIALPREPVRTLQKFDLRDWRTRTKEIGKTAFRAYLPNRAQEYMRTHQDWAIQLSTNWAQIPWELLHDGKEFLCLSRPMARKPAQLKEPRELTMPQGEPYRALVIGNPTGDLRGAEEEALAVANALELKGFQVDRMIGREEAKVTEFSIRISTQPYLLIHFAGHGYFNRTAPNTSELLFSDAPFLAEEFERVLQTRAFIFLSACDAGEGKTIASQGGYRGEFMEGIAVSALLGGALGCLGPMWEIEDGLAKEFAVEFYHHVLSEEPIGEAVRKARLAIHNASSDLWASWILYGEPLQFLIPC